MKTKHSFLCMSALLLTGCASQATMWESTIDPGSDFSTVTIRNVTPFSYQQKMYNDPLDYYHNGFDNLYFN